VVGVPSGGVVATATGGDGGHSATVLASATAAAAVATAAAAAAASTTRCDLCSSRQTYVVDEEDVDPRVDAAVEAGQQYSDRHHTTC